MNEMEKPEWASGRSPDEPLFCWEFLQQHWLTFHNGKFYDRNGCIHDEGPLKQEVFRLVKKYYRSGLQNKVDSLMAAMRLEFQGNDIRTEPNLIHVANGTVDMDGDFTDYKYICRYRLPAKFDPDNYYPAQWVSFLQQLLEPEDILTLQEYLGYCLIPCNTAQKMLIIIGEGGEGKSRIGVAMKAVLGNAMHTGSIAKVEHNRFARADLENILLMVDDDLKLEALNSTNYIKSIITADTPVDLERKGEQSYQGQLYCRFLAFGNGALRALHDRSYGFFRRQIILTTKPRDPNRVDDPYLGEKLAAEADSIFLWCLEGLRRLLDQNYQFTISQRTRSNWEHAIKDSNNIVEFLGSQGYIQFAPKESISSRALYQRYKDWCEDNAVRPLSSRSFWDYMSRNGEKYGLTHTTNVYIGNGKRARGFYGIRALPQM